MKTVANPEAAMINFLFIAGLQNTTEQEMNNLKNSKPNTKQLLTVYWLSNNANKPFKSSTSSANWPILFLLLRTVFDGKNICTDKKTTKNQIYSQMRYKNWTDIISAFDQIHQICSSYKKPNSFKKICCAKKNQPIL